MLADEPRVVVFGSSTISVPVFEAIAQHFRVVLAVMSETPHVRHGKTVPNPVQQWADARLIPVLNGATVAEAELTQGLAAVRVDILFLLSYGRLLPEALLDVPCIASINLHPSALPWYRGAAPIEWQIMDGCTTSAVSIIRMNRLLDRGELLAQRPFDIHPADYRLDVEASIVRVGMPLALEVIRQLASNSVTPLPQVGDGSYARKLKADDGLIDWALPVARVFNLIRALAPEPAASTFQGADRIRILRALPLAPDVQLPPAAVPGLLVTFDRKHAVVRCGDGWLELLQLQFPGKIPMSASDLLNGRRLLLGSILSSHPSP
jgi:methionyl-tRNA formyltransferase